MPTEENLVQAIDRLLQGAIHLTSFRASAFFLLDPSTERLKLRARAQREPHTIPAAAAAWRRIRPTSAPCSAGVIIGGDEIAQSAAWLPPGTATAVCLAVESDAGPIGTLWVYDRRRREPSDREIHVLESISVQVASLLERVVLLRESEAQHRLQRDLQMASQCQAFDVVTSLSPDAGIEAAVRSTSRFEIGGDLCELISVEEGRTVVSIGDASGHGVSASIVMSAVRGAVRALGLDPRTILPADGVLRADQPGAVQHHPCAPIHVLVIWCDRRAAENPDLLQRRPPLATADAQGGAMPLDSHGMLLGVVPDMTYGATVLPLTSGDTLIAFTDGVSEAMNGKRKMFRSDGIIEALQCNQGAAPHVILEAIWSQLETHLDGSAGHDDRSLMVIRVK